MNYRIGDIVEITMVMLAYPTKDKKFKMVPLLRGVLLLNQTFRDVCIHDIYNPSIAQYTILACSNLENEESLYFCRPADI